MNDLNVIDDNINGDGLSITPRIQSYLREIAKWTKFFAILGFVFSGLMILFSLFIMFIIGSLNPSIAEGIGAGVFGGLFYMGFALLYIFPSLYLWRFSDKMKKAIANNDQEFLASSFENLKSFYKFTGILTIVFIALYALILIPLFIFGGASILGGFG